MTGAGIPEDIAAELQERFPVVYQAGREHAARCWQAGMPCPPIQEARLTFVRYQGAGERFEATWWLGCLDQLAAIEREEDHALVTGRGAEYQVARPFAIPQPGVTALTSWSDALRQWAAAISR